MSISLDREQILVEEAKKNPERFAELYDRYFEQIYRYVHRRVSNDDLAQDLVSQTFYDALSHLKSYQFRGYPFSSWLYKIAHNNVLKWYRENSKATMVELEKAEDIKDKVDIKAEAVINEQNKGIMALLAQMEPEEQEMLKLKYFEEISNIEIGEVMGISANNVGVKLYRALKKLKQLMDNNQPQDGSN